MGREKTEVRTVAAMRTAKPVKGPSVCVQCGQAYTRSRSDQQFCGQRCSSQAWRDRRRSTSEKTCLHCKALFSSSIPHQRFCTSECRVANGNAAKVEARAGGPGKDWAKGREFAARDKCIACGSEFYAPPALKRRGGGKFCSNNCRTRAIALNPNNYPQTRGRRGNGGKREDLENRYFRSAWEANYARYLNWLVDRKQIAKWEFEVDTFEFHAIKKGQRFYTPDFKVFSLSGRHEYHEVKGYMDAKSATKLKRMAKYYPEEKVVLIGKKEYQSIARTMGPMLPNWEGRHGRND